jgi:nitrite reductase/ring-hydroxylating ferredoxin subunit
MKKIATLSLLKEHKKLQCDLSENESIALFLKDGKIYAISNFCPHKGAPLSEGHLEGFNVVCPWHCWKFDIINGNCEKKENIHVKTYKTHLKDDDIYLVD